MPVELQLRASFGINTLLICPSFLGHLLGMKSLKWLCEVGTGTALALTRLGNYERREEWLVAQEFVK